MSHLKLIDSNTEQELLEHVLDSAADGLEDRINKALCILDCIVNHENIRKSTINNKGEYCYRIDFLYINGEPIVD